MSNSTITVPVVMDAKTFQSFALFDTLRRQKRWRSPLLFAAIMIAFAIVCYAMHGRVAQAVLVGTVLLVIGLILPIAYFLSFWLSVRGQIKKMGLKKQSRAAYTLTLSRNDGVVASVEEQHVTHTWDQLYAAYRMDGCTYLYTAANRAYLLPDNQVTAGADALWNLLTDMLPAEKRFDRRRVKA